jgi:copper transport protein
MFTLHVMRHVAAARLIGCVRTALLVATGALVAPFVLIGPLAEPAGAHATLIGTNPTDDELLDAAPDAVELQFDEGVELTDDSIEVIGPDGGRVHGGSVETAEGDSVLRAPIDGDQRGTYTVAWRVTSADSHTISGSFVFHVEERTGAAELDDDDDAGVGIAGFLGRWFGFAGTLVVVGGAALATLSGRDSAVAARLRPLVGAAAVVGVLGVLVALVAQVADNAGRGWWDGMSLVPDAISDSRTAGLMGLRAGLLWLAALTALIGLVWRWWPAVVMVFGVGSIVTASLGGHAWTSDQRWVAVVSDTAHFGAVAAWVGGLVALLVALRVAADRGRLARRFSALALGAVGVVALTGVISGIQNVDSLDGLTTTGYGRLLLAKVALFLALVGFGWANRARLLPLVDRTVGPLSRSLRGEIAVAAIVVGLTAALVNQPPARGEPELEAEPFSAAITATTEDGDEVPGSLQLDVIPATAGPNDLHLYFRDDDGMPLSVDAVQVVAALPPEIPERRLDIEVITPDHVSVIAASLPTPGTWTIETTAIREGEPLIFTAEVPIP